MFLPFLGFGLRSSRLSQGEAVQGYEVRGGTTSKYVNSIVQMHLPIPLNLAVKYVHRVVLFLSTWFKVLQTPRPFRKAMQY